MIFVYILLALMISLLIIAALMPKAYQVEKSVIIAKQPHFVMDKVGDLNNYSRWNPWQQSDPTTQSTITGTPHRTGHKYAWEGKKVGVGSLTLLDENTRHIHFELEFIKPWKSKAKDNWLFEEWGNGSETKVTWLNAGELPWPMARLMGPMINKSLNHQFTVGLDNLKKMCEG
ncbi:MAG: SRPBCC family protein [Chitinophagaceae bacterium]|nr:SRPBCC family protein [Chitinophagaceae bacterium]